MMTTGLIILGVIVAVMFAGFYSLERMTRDDDDEDPSYVEQNLEGERQ